MFSNGFIWTLTDVAHEEEPWNIPLPFMMQLFSIFLRGSKMVYEKMGYQGELQSTFGLRGVRGVPIRVTDDLGFIGGNKPALNDTYEVDFKTSTVELNDEEGFAQTYLSPARRMCYTLGYDDLGDDYLLRYKNK